MWKYMYDVEYDIFWKSICKKIPDLAQKYNFQFKTGSNPFPPPGPKFQHQLPWTSTKIDNSVYVTLRANTSIFDYDFPFFYPILRDKEKLNHFYLSEYEAPEGSVLESTDRGHILADYYNFQVLKKVVAEGLKYETDYGEYFLAFAPDDWIGQFNQKITNLSIEEKQKLVISSNLNPSKFYNELYFNEIEKYVLANIDKLNQKHLESISKDYEFPFQILSKK